ncbi:MAG: hypothetical protein AAF235_05975 [Planctomycetota bacterium]
MAARLAVTVVVFGLIACGLLEYRHARLQAAHGLAASHERIRRLDEETLRIRAELAREAAAAAERAERSAKPPTGLSSSLSGSQSVEEAVLDERPRNGTLIRPDTDNPETEDAA